MIFFGLALHDLLLRRQGIWVKCRTSFSPITIGCGDRRAFSQGSGFLPALARRKPLKSRLSLPRWLSPAAERDAGSEDKGHVAADAALRIRGGGDCLGGVVDLPLVVTALP